MVVANVPSGARLGAARDRATAAVVRAYGAGRLSDASCARLLDTVQQLQDPVALDRLADTIDRAPAAVTAAVGPRPDGGIATVFPDGAASAVPDGGAMATSPGGTTLASPGGAGAASYRAASGALRRAGAGPPMPRLDAVDLALAARAGAPGRSWSNDRRTASLVAVVAMLVALVVLGVALVLALRSDMTQGSSGTSAPTGAPALPGTPAEPPR